MAQISYYLEVLNWSFSSSDNAGVEIMSVHKADWNVRFMSGTHIMQASRAKFDKHEVNPSCLLCCNEQENT